MKLLIADDQKSLHTFLDKTMDWTALGITEKKHAYDGRETLQLLEEFLPDVVILDIQMPYMTGIETLRQLDETVKKPKTIILSAHDEFSYARDALRLEVYQYLLKPVDIVSLTATIQELLSTIREEEISKLSREFGKLVHTRTLEPASIAKVKRALNLLQIQYIAVLDLLNAADVSKSQLQEQLLWTSSVIPPIIYRRSQDYYSVLVGLDSMMDMDQLKELSRLVGASGRGQTQELAQFLQDIPVMIGVSPLMAVTGDSAHRLLELVKRSEEALMAGFYTDDPVNVYGEVVVSQEWRMADFQPVEQAFREMVVHDFNLEAAKKLSADLFRQIRSLQIHPEGVYSIVLHMLYAIAQSSPRMAGTTSGRHTMAMEDLRQCRHVTQLEQLFNEFLTSIADSIKGVNPAVDLMMRIKQYIDLNYGEDLSLQVIADRFGIDKFQLSRLFKQEMDINYWNYVLQVRVEKAADLLIRTDEKNSLIASVTGFVDESHFSRTFKKYYGMSPKQYRQSRQNDH
ncbi:helix-turn-helix domain-containing protein [Paenibacillus cisolokensis]|uniref:response regulator transcription factor n=1 Tax=Paenibacillus cisolokensis TaxID=1658519 RepID=UPI003D2E252C